MIEPAREHPAARAAARRTAAQSFLAQSFLALAALSLVALSLAAAAGPAWARTPDALAAAIPTEVVDVVSGGTWADGAATGTYRIVTVVSGTDREYGARVFIQWVQHPGEAGPPLIARTVAVAEFNELAMPHAVVTLEADIENQASVLIAAEDRKTQRTALVAVQAGKPGVYLAKVSPAAKN